MVGAHCYVGTEEQCQYTLFRSSNHMMSYGVKDPGSMVLTHTRPLLRLLLVCRFAKTSSWPLIKQDQVNIINDVHTRIWTIQESNFTVVLYAVRSLYANWTLGQTHMQSLWFTVIMIAFGEENTKGSFC